MGEDPGGGGYGMLPLTPALSHEGERGIIEVPDNSNHPMTRNTSRKTSLSLTEGNNWGKKNDSFRNN
jgi:hypothetical protein